MNWQKITIKFCIYTAKLYPSSVELFEGSNAHIVLQKETKLSRNKWFPPWIQMLKGKTKFSDYITKWLFLTNMLSLVTNISLLRYNFFIISPPSPSKNDFFLFRPICRYLISCKGSYIMLVYMLHSAVSVFCSLYSMWLWEIYGMPSYVHLYVCEEINS